MKLLSSRLSGFAGAKLLFCAGMALMGTSSALASDLSVISGLYKKGESKVNDKNAGSSQAIELGGRFGQSIDGNLGWFAQGMLSLKNYDTPDGTPDLDDSTSLSAGGGLRFAGKPWSTFATPYLWGMGEFKAVKDADVATSTETEKNGLYYSGGVGLRLAIDADFFVDLESPMFSSALFATETTTVKSIDATGKEQKQETKSSKTELYGSTSGPFQSMTVGLGVRL